jgi:hypothetical protein
MDNVIYNGEEMTLSKANKCRMMELGNIKFQDLKLKYDIKEISNENGYILFSLGDLVQYYFTPYGGGKIKLIDGVKWTGKIVTQFKNDFKGNIPLSKIPVYGETIKVKKSSNNNKVINFGKHKGKTFDYLYEFENQYFMWLYNSTTNFSLKKKMKKYL